MGKRKEPTRQPSGVPPGDKEARGPHAGALGALESFERCFQSAVREVGKEGREDGHIHRESRTRFSPVQWRNLLLGTNSKEGKR